MAYNTMEASDYRSHVDHASRIADSPCDKKQKAATSLLRDTIQKRDFATLIAARASRILRPMAQIGPTICNAVAFYVLACARQSGSSLTMKSKTPELDALTSWIFSRTSTSALCFIQLLQSALEEIICSSISLLRHLRSLQNGIVVMDIDAFRPRTITVAIQTIQETS